MINKLFIKLFKSNDIRLVHLCHDLYVRHIGILLAVSISTIFRNRRVILHPAAEFRPNRNIRR